MARPVPFCLLSIRTLEVQGVRRSPQRVNSNNRIELPIPTDLSRSAQANKTYSRIDWHSCCMVASRYLTTSLIDTMPATRPTSMTGTCRNLPAVIHPMISLVTSDHAASHRLIKALIERASATLGRRARTRCQQRGVHSPSPLRRQSDAPRAP
jgi:hypothetical protein